jgi:hypothetical protein
MINGEQIARARQIVGWSPSILQQRARRMTTGAIKRAEEGDETALTAEQLTAIERAFSRAGVLFINGVPVLTRANPDTLKSLLIVAPWLSAFWTKTSLQQKHWEVLMLVLGGSRLAPRLRQHPPSRAAPAGPPARSGDGAAEAPPQQKAPRGSLQAGLKSPLRWGGGIFLVSEPASSHKPVSRECWLTQKPRLSGRE